VKQAIGLNYYTEQNILMTQPIRNYLPNAHP